MKNEIFKKNLRQSRHKIIFLVGLDEYFLSHRQPACRAAMELGYSVTVVAKDTGKRSMIEALGCHFIETPIPNASSNLFTTALSIIKVRQIINSVKPNILHNIGMQNSLIGTSASLGSSVGVTCNSINGTGHVFTRNDAKTRVIRAIVKTWFKLLNSIKQSVFIFQNEEDKEIFTNLGIDPKTTSLIKGSGVDTTLYSPTLIPKSPIVIGAAFRLIDIKGVRDLCKAMRIIETILPNVKLRLAGRVEESNPGSITSADLAHFMGQPNIIIEGYVENMVAFWRDCHLAIQPSHGGEGVPMSLLQAASMGRPIITTDTSGNNTICLEGKNGLLVPPKNPEALANAIITLCSDLELIKTMGAESIRVVCDGGFSAETVERAMKSVYLICQQQTQPNTE